MDIYLSSFGLSKFVGVLGLFLVTCRELASSERSRGFVFFLLRIREVEKGESVYRFTNMILRQEKLLLVDIKED